MSDITTILKDMQRELMALKGMDYAAPRLLSDGEHGVQSVPVLQSGQGVEVTVTSSAPDFPFFSAGTYDAGNESIADTQLSYYREDTGGLSNVNKWMFPDAPTSQVLSLRWSVLGQSVSKVDFEVVKLDG